MNLADAISKALNSFQGQSIDGPDDVQTITKAVVAAVDKEFQRLRAQAKCGHDPWPCNCDYRGKGFNPRA